MLPRVSIRIPTTIGHVLSFGIVDTNRANARASAAAVMVAPGVVGYKRLLNGRVVTILIPREVAARKTQELTSIPKHRAVR